MTTHFTEVFYGQPANRAALIEPRPVVGSLCPEGNLGHLLLRAAETDCGIVFVRDKRQENRYSYQTLAAHARRRLGALRGLGLKRGDPVMLMFRESHDFVVSFWAAVLGGMIPAPLAYPAALNEDNAVLLKLKAVWEQMDRPLILADDLLAERQAELQAALGDVRFRVVAVSSLAESAALAEPDLAGTGDLAFVQYSSGSTGNPKGIMLTHANLLTNLEGIVSGAEMDDKDAFLSWMPYHHDMGLIGFHLTPIALGIEQINLTPFTFVRDPGLWLEKIHEHRATITGSPNFGYRHLLSKLKPEQVGRWDLSCLRLIFNGAEPISAMVVEEFMAALAPCGLKPEAMYPVFGMAEACLAVSFPPVGTLPRLHWLERKALAGKQAVSVPPGAAGALAMMDEGYPVPGCGVRIVDGEDRVLNEGEVGHVHIAGANVTTGYYRNPEATAANIRDGWLDTGDLGFILDGRLCLSGRSKDIIFINGQNFYAHDLEAQADKVAGVESGKTAACGWQDSESGEERTALFVALRKPDDAAGQSVLKAVWQSINESLGVTLDYVVPVKTIPKTTSGKTQRYKLLEELLAGVYAGQAKTGDELAGVTASKAEESQEQDMLELVRAVWAEVLGLPAARIGVEQSYRALGGTSLKAVQILGSLEDRLGRGLDHELLLRCQTVRQMADWLSGEKPKAAVGRVEVSNSADEPIAIIGMACRFPGSDTPEEFWDHLSAGRELIGPVPQDRFLPPNGGREDWWRGGFIRDAYAFDAEFFGISPEEATDMDPQQRVFLEVAAETLERAGYSRSALNGADVGLIIGASHNNHMEFLVNALCGESLEDFASLRSLGEQEREDLLKEWQARFGRFSPNVNTAVDNLLNMIAARVSHTFNWKGPSLTVDSACSSSLVAVHLACQSLRLGECSMAIAGGVSLTLSHTPYQLFRRAGVLSPSGRCSVFDSAADGFVLGEGAGAVLLKPLSRALADGDPVHAVIRGSAVNNDGQSLGVMAPNPDGQRRVIEAVYRQFGLSPASIQFVEAHGTGTPLGDPSEIRALSQVYAGLPRQSCAIGSVKANIGHLLSAAGIASLVKVVLALQQRSLPGNVNLDQPSRQIDFDQSPFLPLTQTREWTSPEGAPRRAAINSFGFGGTNCHLVVEEAAPVEAQAESWPTHLLLLSARSRTALNRWGERLAAHLEQAPALGLADVCATVNSRRTHYDCRLPLVCASRDDLIKTLRNLEQRQANEIGKSAPVALMFTGQGAQYPGMAAYLLEHWPRFRRAMEEAQAAFAPWLEEPLLASIYHPEADPDRLARTDLTQPVLFAVDYALGRSLLELGLRPAALLGHSIGEYVAACLAGCVDLNDAAKVVAARGRLMAGLPDQGGMLAAFAGIDELSVYLENYRGRLWFAANNGSHQVVAGYSDALAELTRTLETDGRRFKQLRVSHAFHTPLLEPMLPAFAEILREVRWQAPKLPLISNVSGDWFGDQIPDADYWQRHVLEPVRFEQGLRTAFAGGVRAFVECGPDRVLSNLAASVLTGETVTLTALVNRRREASLTLPEALGALWAVGVDFDTQALHEDFPGRRIPLPTYPFTRTTYRLGPPPSAGSRGQALLHRWEWRLSTRGESLALAPGAILAFVGDGQDAWLAALRLRLGADRPVIAVRPGSAFFAGNGEFVVDPVEAPDYRAVWQAFCENHGEPAAIIHAWNAELSEALREEDSALHAGAFSFAYLAQAMRESGSVRPCRVLWLTRRAHALDSLEPAPDPYQLVGISFALGYAEEEANLMVQAVDLDPTPAAPETEVEAALCELASAEFGGDILSIRRGQRLERSFGAVYHDASSPEPLLRDGDTCLITGGIAGIGAETALALAGSARINLVLTGRSPLPSREHWDSLPDEYPHAERVALLRQLEAIGATVEYYAADAADAEAMAQVIAGLSRRFGRLDGVIHCAGVVDRMHLRAADKTRDSIQAVFAPKLKGTRLLHELTADQPLKFFILYSSIAATCPHWAASLTDYAAANAFLDGFAEWRNRSGAPGRSLALNWSLWEDRGMGRDAGLLALVRGKGLRALVPEIACGALARALAMPGAAVVHVIDYEQENAQAAPEVKPAELRPLAEAPAQRLPESIAVPAGTWLDQIRARTAHCLACPPESVEASRKFLDMGMDSRIAVEIAESLGVLLGQAVTPTLLFEFQTPLDLAEHLENRYGRDCLANRAPVQAPAQSPVPAIASLDRSSAARRDVAGDEAIAIIGMGLRIPGAANTGEYWAMLAEGRSVIGEVPAERWSPADFFDPTSAQSDSTYSKWGGFIDKPYDFDAQFFGISPREAKAMDPQQRIFMEVAFEALQQAGYGGECKASRLGVFVGCEQDYYAGHFINLQHYRQLRARIKRAPWYQHLPSAARSEWDEALREVLRPAEIVSDAVAGNGLNEIACRLSHWINARGPSLAVNTACSAALVALHLACQSLRSGESRVAVAGGAYMNMGATPFVFLSRVNAMSPDGRCYPFDSRANGLVLGEGVSALVLKPLSAAQADGDHIHGVILGSAMNNDGHSSGLTAPNPAGQAECVARAYAESDVPPESVSYIECHGTGTALGDPVEVEGMSQAFRRFTDKRGYCGIGSVKSSIGHMLSAAGIPSVIKVLLAMEHEHLPETVNYAEPNPYIDFAGSPFYVVGKGGQAWQRDGAAPRRAGVNAFGFGGTNCHLILQEPPRPLDQPTGMAFAPVAGPQLLCLTGRSEAAVRVYADSLRRYLAAQPAVTVEQVAATLNRSQREMNQRAAACVSGREDLLAVLAALADGQAHPRLAAGRANPKQPTAVHWSFDNQPWPEGAAEVLARRYPVFASAWSEFRAAMSTQTQQATALPAVAEQYALARLLRALDLTPAGLSATGVAVAAAAAAADWISPATAVAWLSGESAAVADIGPTPLRASLHTAVGRLEWNEPALADRLRQAMSVTTPLAAEPGLILSLGGVAVVGEHSLRAIGGRQADASLLESLSRLYIEGHKPDLRPLCPTDVRRVPLPTYPFERKEFVFDAPTDGRGEESEKVFAMPNELPVPTVATARENTGMAADVPSFTDGPDLFGNALLDELKRINWPLELEEEEQL